MSLVGGADLLESGAALAQDVGHPEGIADLDHLSPGNEDLAPLGQGVENEEHGRRVVVDHQCPRAIQDRFQQASGDDVSLAPAAAGQVEFKVGVVGGDFLQLPAGGISHRRSSQVGVQNYAGGVDDLLQAGAGPGVKLLLQGLLNAFLQFRGRPLLFGALRQLPAQVIQDPADQEGDEGDGWSG